MSNEESIAGINVRQLRDDNKRLKDAIDMLVDANHRLQAHLLTREDRIQQLEEALRQAMDFAEYHIRPTVGGSLADDLQEILSAALASLREPSEAPEKEED